MNQPPLPEDATGNPTGGPSPAANDLECIRDLLFGQEKRQLDGLQERIENPGLHAHDVSRVLPQAVTLALAKGGQLTAALTPAVETALKESVKRDPSTLVNAIFPIIGPAIRKSITETLSQLVQSLNQTLEHSFSPKGFKWRLEAARTGKSFAEVVLAHTLLYRVEQVFLIHKQTGLLLLHVVGPQIQAQDANMVSGMLTAIQDFAQDSFRVASGEMLHTLQIGELNVWVESSPIVKLAAVIRGQAPYEFRGALQGALENIHREQGAALESFDGDAAPFELARRHLTPCLRSQFAEAATKNSALRLPVLAGVPVVIVVVWLGFGIRDQRRWTGFLERLKAEPGIVVTEAGKRAGKYFVAGLHDPLARDPASLLPEFKLKPEKVASRWEPYQALSPELIRKRAVRLLQPPASVALRTQNGVLFASGNAPGGWIENARLRAVLLPGIQSFDDSELIDESQAGLAARQRDIEQATVFFEAGLQLAAGQAAVIEMLPARFVALSEAALRSGKRVHVSVIGHSDQTGTDEQNLRLSRQRAEHVAGQLVARGAPAALLTTVGVGARHPWQADLPEPEQFKNRRVTFRVLLEPMAKP